MTKANIKEIIESYMQKDVPEEVQESFERWLTDIEASDEKDEALKVIWDELPLSAAAVPGDPMSVLKEAERLENIETAKMSRRKTAWLWVTSSVVACLCLFMVCQYVFFDRNITCLASSVDAKGEFVLPDGSKVWLNKDSRLYYSDNLQGRTRQVRLDGEGYFDVAEDAAHPFIVSAGDMSIKVVGTRFTLTAYESEPVRAYLEEGCIKASVKGHDELTLLPDQAVVFNPADNSFKAFAENAADHTVWTGGKMEFVNKSLSDIIQSLEHWYCISISCNDMKKASAIRLSMVIRHETVDEILGAMCQIADFSYFVDSEGNIKISFER